MSQRLVERVSKDGTAIQIDLVAGDDEPIAAAVLQGADFFEATGYRWHVWSSRMSTASPLAARDETSVRAWLHLLADLYENGAQ